MTSGIDHSTSVPAPLVPPNLRPARFEDYSQIAALEQSHQMRTRSERDWRAMWEENPLWDRLSQDWPIGWVLENEIGKVVGSIVNVPSTYHFHGRELLCANGRAWVCSTEYRGFAMLLMDEYFNQPNVDLFINTTVGPVATGTLDQYAAHVPAGDWNTIAFMITGYRGFARGALARKGAPLPGLFALPAGAILWLKDGLSAKSNRAPDTSVVIESADKFDARFDTFWAEFVKKNPHKLLADRDSKSLTWHFSLAMRNNRLWILIAIRNGVMQAYCIVKRDDHNQPVRRMRVIDFQSIDGGHDLLPPLIEAARRRCAAAGIHMFEHLGTGLPKMRAFDERASYRRRLGHWPFYYQAADAPLQKELADPAVWDPSAYDGDSSFE